MDSARQTGASALLDVYDQHGFVPVRGEGVWLFDHTGARWLDFYGGHAVALLGNAHPRLVSTLAAQASQLFFQSNVVRLDVRDRAGARLAAFAPQGLSHVFFVNSGAEANENALRVAFLATRRSRVVCVEGSFHGRSAAASAVTAKHDRWYGFPRMPFEVDVVPFDDTTALARAVGADTAAIIVEPVQGIAGARPMSPGFLHAARTLSAQSGAALVFDEVQCGMGRTGHPFAAQAFGVTPDILTTAKGLAGGFPAGALLMTNSFAAHLRHGDLGTTFGGGPLASALIEAVIDVIESDGLLSRVQRLSERLRQECVVGPVTSVQGMGFLLGLRTSMKAADVLAALREKRILAGGSSDPYVLRLLPPLVLDDEHVDTLVTALKEIA